MEFGNRFFRQAVSAAVDIATSMPSSSTLSSTHGSTLSSTGSSSGGSSGQAQADEGFFATNWKWLAIGGGAATALVAMGLCLLIRRRNARQQAELLTQTYEPLIGAPQSQPQPAPAELASTTSRRPSLTAS